MVVVVDPEASRNDWPTGIIEETKTSSDGLVRSAKIRVMRLGKSKTIERPANKLITLVEFDKT